MKTAAILLLFLSSSCFAASDIQSCKKSDECVVIVDKCGHVGINKKYLEEVQSAGMWTWKIALDLRILSAIPLNQSVFRGDAKSKLRPNRNSDRELDAWINPDLPIATRVFLPSNSKSQIARV